MVWASASAAARINSLRELIERIRIGAMPLARDHAERALGALEERTPESAAILKAAPAVVLEAAGRVLAASDFVADTLARDAALLPLLLARPPDFAGALPLSDFVSAERDEAQFMAGLRRWRRAELARIAWRDLAGWAGLPETLLELSNAADTAIRAAQEFAWRQLSDRHGLPATEDPDAQRLVVIAMGKLGGQELNFSSDVDLIFLFDAHGETARSPAADARGILSAPRAAVDTLPRRAQRRGACVSRRHAAAPLRRQRPAGRQYRGVRGLS